MTQESPTTDELSARRHSREQLSLAAVDSRAAAEQEIAYAARDFVVCGLPFKRPREGGLVYRRHNGEIDLEINAHPAHGLPYGQDRLIPIWLATAFFASGSPADNVIRFRCATDILRAFGLETDGGKNLARMRERLLRVFWSTYGVTRTWKGANGEPLRERRRFQLMRFLRVNTLEDRRRASNQYTLWQDWIELDAGFAAELRDGGRIPIDLETVRALKESSPALDLYVWQAWRSYRLLCSHQTPTSIPIFGDGGLMAQLGSEAQPREARRSLRIWQALIQRVWQGCPNYLDDACERIYINPGAAITVASNKLPELPGVSPNPPPLRVTPTGHAMSLHRDDDPREEAGRTA